MSNLGLHHVQTFGIVEESLAAPSLLKHAHVFATQMGSCIAISD